MTVHLIKMAVGIADLEDLIERRRLRRQREGDGPLRVTTRHKPKREAEILEGGSIYWVIKGLVRVRQKVLGFAEGQDSEGKPCCVILCDHVLVTTEPLPFRPFQGWRYLAEKAAPLDRPRGEGDELPAKLVRELRALGLL
jgi:hypothetical protein